MSERDHDVTSPPYPGPGLNMDGLYGCLRELRAWLKDQRAEANAAAGCDLVPALRGLPDKASYAAQPVMQLFHHYAVLHRLREWWDHLVRCYEGAWTAPMAVRLRAGMAAAMAVMWNDAFTPFESREAREQALLARYQQAAQDALLHLLRQHGVTILTWPDGTPPEPPEPSVN